MNSSKILLEKITNCIECAASAYLNFFYSLFLLKSEEEESIGIIIENITKIIMDREIMPLTHDVEEMNHVNRILEHLLSNSKVRVDLQAEIKVILNKESVAKTA